MTRRPEQPLHVLMTADTVGGVWTYALDLARAAADAVRTTLVVLGPPPEPDQQRAARDIPGLRLILAGTPLDWTADTPEALAGSARPIQWVAERVRPDIIHLNSPALAAHARFAAPVVGACHSCLATWWSAVKGGPMPDDFRWRTQALGEGLHGHWVQAYYTHLFVTDAGGRVFADVQEERVVFAATVPA